MSFTDFNRPTISLGYAKLFARGFIFVIAAFYAYGALVHILNMLSLTGFDWATAPLKWQVLDLIYLVLDIVVAAGLVLSWRIGFVGFFCAAISQTVLYTVLRPWIIDVPSKFERSLEELAYLDMLVMFHCVTILAMIFCLFVLRARVSPPDPVQQRAGKRI